MLTADIIVITVRLSLLTPAGRILEKFRGSLDTAVDLTIRLEDDNPVKMELLQLLHQHLCILREDVKDNMKQTLISSVILTPGQKLDLQTISEEYGTE